MKCFYVHNSSHKNCHIFIADIGIHGLHDLDVGLHISSRSVGGKKPPPASIYYNGSYENEFNFNNMSINIFPSANFSQGNVHVLVT